MLIIRTFKEEKTQIYQNLSVMEEIKPLIWKFLKTEDLSSHSIHIWQLTLIRSQFPCCKWTITWSGVLDLVSGRNFTSWLLHYRWIEVSHDGNKYCYKSGHFPRLPKTVIWQRITWNKNWFVKEFLLRCNGIGGISAVLEHRLASWPGTVG